MVTGNSDDNLKAALAYLFGPLSGIYFLMSEKKNEYIRFHAMQSTVVFGALWLLYVVFAIIPIIGWLIGLLLSPLYGLVYLAVLVVLMFKAFGGEKYKLPYFGDLAEKQLAKLKT